MFSFPRSIPVVVAVLASAFALSACEGEVSIGEKTISASNLESETSKSLAAETGVEPASVDCPDDLKAEVDATETCELTDPQGNTYDAVITVTSVDDDGNAQFNIQVGDIKQMGDAPE